MPLAVASIDIEIIILSKGRQRKKNTMILFIFGIQKKRYKWIYLQNRNRLTDVENKLIVIKWEREGRDKLGGSD